MPNLPTSLLGISCDLKGVEISAAFFDDEIAGEPAVFVAARQDGQGSSSDAALGLVDEVLGNFARSSPRSLIALGSGPGDWLDGVVFNAGPGGFTAVRAACAVAQGLSFGWSKSVAAISSLEAWAESVACERVEGFALGQHEEILVLLDARMGELYAGHFRLAWSGLTGGRDPYSLSLLGEAVLSPDVVETWIQTNRASTNSLLTHEASDGAGASRSPLDASASWVCGDFYKGFPALAKALEAQAWRTPESLDEKEPRLCSKSLLRRAFMRRETVFQAPSLVGPHYVRNKVALNSSEQQALRDQHRAAALIPQRG